MSKISEDTLKLSCASIPYFDAFRVSSDDSVEYWVIQYTECGLIISQVMVSWFIIIVEDKSSPSSNDSLWRVCDCKATDLIERTVEGLNCSEGTDVPNSKHARDIC